MPQCGIIPEVCSSVIAKFCTGAEIAQFCRLNKQNNEHYSSEEAWSLVFQRDFPTLEKQGTWRKSYSCLATFLGTAVEDFRDCANSFHEISGWVKQNTPEIFGSFVEPYAYVDLLDAYSDLNVPDIARVLYVLSRGQKALFGNNWNCGLFGFYEFYNHRSCLHFMDITSDQANPYIPHLFHSESQGWAAIPTEMAGVDVFIFACAPDRGVSRGSSLGIRLDTMEVVSISQGLQKLYTVATSLPGFLSWYASELTSNNFDVTEGGIDRFPNSHECNSECTTNGVRIRASSLLICGMSEGKYIFPYKISMTATADVERSQLTTRKWVCYEDGRTPDIVEGPGVIGLYPVVEWGMEKFIYLSCTQNRAEKGHMEGHFAFKRDSDGLEFNALIAPFRQHLNLTQRF